MGTTLVLQSFGRENEYKRALFTILSYYAHTSLPVQETKVVLFTDAPDYFTPYVQGLPVHYVLLTPEKIKAMRGAIDFLHRMKIALIEEAFGLLQGNMLYADSDTFFTADPTPVVQQVSETRAFMHVWEYHFAAMKDWPLPAGQTFRAFYNLITSRSFTLANGMQVQVKPEQSSWNAGVMIFHPAHARFIPDVYALTDQFYPPSQNHASEQYAFSVMMQENTTLAACDEVIYHYWYRVKKQIVDQFLAQQLNSKWAQKDLHQKLEEVKSWSAKMPSYFKEHIWTKRDNAIQAFNEDKFSEGYKWASKALVQQPLHGAFIKDVFYHVKRHLKR